MIASQHVRLQIWWFALECLAGVDVSRIIILLLCQMLHEVYHNKIQVYSKIYCQKHAGYTTWPFLFQIEPAFVLKASN